MERSGQLYAPTSLSHERNAAPAEKEAGLAQETVWTFWRREISCLFTGIQTPNIPARNPINYTDRTGPIPYVFRLTVKINRD